MKVLFLQTNYHNKLNEDKPITHGVDYARVINPGKYLSTVDGFEVSIRKDPIKGYEEKDWDELTKNWDIIYSSYIDSPVGYVSMALHARKNNCIWITDVDDNLWEVPEQSPVHKVYHLGSEKLHSVSSALEDTAYLTTTNLFLKYKLVKYLKKKHEDIKVFPNYIDLSLYDYSKIKRKKTKDIVISYYGTNTHGPDIMQDQVVNALTKICVDNPNVRFQTIGFFLPQMKTKLKRQYQAVNGEGDFDKWVPLWHKIMGETDIVIAPLTDTDFNKSKSNIKALEYGAAKMPGVYQNIRQYKEYIGASGAGLLSSNEKDWYTHLKALVDSADLRREVGENAYKLVSKHTIQGHIGEYAEYFTEVFNNYKPIGNLLNAGFVLSK